MSFNNLSIGSAGADRLGSAEPVSKPKAAELATDRLDHSLPININNTLDLRQAELKGEKYTISDAQLVKAIEHAIKAVQGKSTTLEFSIHEKTKLISVKVLDKETGETIREVPPEKSLDFAAKLWEMAGIIIDERR